MTVNAGVPSLVGISTMDNFWMNFLTENYEVILINIQTKTKVLSTKINNGHSTKPQFAQPWVDLSGNSYIVYTNFNAQLTMLKISQTGTISWDRTFFNLPNTFSFHCNYYATRNQFFVMSITKKGGTNNDFNVMIFDSSGTLSDF